MKIRKFLKFKGLFLNEKASEKLEQINLIIIRLLAENV